MTISIEIEWHELLSRTQVNYCYVNDPLSGKSSDESTLKQRLNPNMCLLLCTNSSDDCDTTPVPLRLT